MGKGGAQPLAEVSAAWMEALPLGWFFGKFLGVFPLGSGLFHFFFKLFAPSPEIPPKSAHLIFRSAFRSYEDVSFFVIFLVGPLLVRCGNPPS